MNDDINGDEAMKNFEDLGRKLFQAPKEEENADEVSEEDALDDE